MTKTPHRQLSKQAREFFRQTGRKGGQAQVRRHGVKALREWGKRGGRPQKLTPTEIRAARKLREKGETITAIAKLFGVSRYWMGQLLKQEKPHDQNRSSESPPHHS